MIRRMVLVALLLGSSAPLVAQQLMDSQSPLTRIDSLSVVSLVKMPWSQVGLDSGTVMDKLRTTMELSLRRSGIPVSSQFFPPQLQLLITAFHLSYGSTLYEYQLVLIRPAYLDTQVDSMVYNDAIFQESKWLQLNVKDSAVRKQRLSAFRWNSFARSYLNAKPFYVTVWSTNGLGIAPDQNFLEQLVIAVTGMTEEFENDYLAQVHTQPK